MKLAVVGKSLKVGAVFVVVVAYSAAVFYIGARVTKLKNTQQVVRSEGKSDAIERPTPQENVISANILSSNVKLCANTTLSFEIAYPSDWFTTYNNKEEECFFLAPYTFVVPNIPDDAFTPITIKRIPVDEWEATVKSFENPNDLFSVLSFKNLEINARPIKYIEAISTGNSHPKSYYRITYMAYDANTPLEFTYMQQTLDEDTKNYRKVLETIVNSLRYF